MSATGNSAGTPVGGSPDPSAAMRVGEAERQAAIGRLGEHWQAGRLDPAEHERRTTAAFHAQTRADLDALFTDLPGGGSTAQLGGVVVPPEVGIPLPATVPPPAPGPVSAGPSWWQGARGRILAVTPLAATALFFLTHHWEFFLAIPIVGALVGSGHGGGDDRARAERRRERKERRGGR